jgi:hypothetical protein
MRPFLLNHFTRLPNIGDNGLDSTKNFLRHIRTFSGSKGLIPRSSEIIELSDKALEPVCSIR